MNIVGKVYVVHMWLLVWTTISRGSVYMTIFVCLQYGVVVELFRVHGVLLPVRPLPQLPFGRAEAVEPLVTSVVSSFK